MVAGENKTQIPKAEVQDDFSEYVQQHRQILVRAESTDIKKKGTVLIDPVSIQVTVFLIVRQGPENGVERFIHNPDSRSRDSEVFDQAAL